MPPVQNSPQYQDLTTSTNGRNVGASLQAVSHFFLEDNAFTQSAGEAFGVVSATEFATTAKVSFSGSKKVYAICQGQLFVQPHESDVNKVNVILKPFKYPINSLAVKYFIYRGLNKGDFFDNVVYQGANRLKIAGSETTGSGLVQHLWKEFNRFYTGAPGGAPVFLEEFIGFPATPGSQLVTDFIDQYFFKIARYDEQTNEEIPGFDFELPLIPRGLELGTATGALGIDVVLNQGDFYYENDPCPFRFDLSFARSAFHKLKTEATNTVYQNKLVKEMCMQFIDIAAFYGLHASGKGKLYVGTATTPFESKEDIYTRIQNFYTKNTVYLYIQSNRQRSYNFYGNYNYSDAIDFDIKTGTDINNMSASVFNTNWPMMTFDNQIGVILQLITGNEDTSALFVQQGFLDVSTEHENNFLRGINLLQEDIDTNDIRYTKPLHFNFIRTSSNIPVSSIIQLIYEGSKLSVTEISSDPNVLPVERELKDIDDVLGLLGAITHVVQTSENNQESLTDKNLRLLHFENRAAGRDTTVAKMRYIKDHIDLDGESIVNRITYETLLTDIAQNVDASKKSRSSYKESNNLAILSIGESTNGNYTPNTPYFLQTHSLTDNNQSVVVISLHVSDTSTPSKKILGLTEDENVIFTTLKMQYQLNNVRFYFRSELADDSAYYTAPENIKYKRYSLAILGENEIGVLKLYFPDNEVFVITMDDMAYTTNGYTKYLVQQVDEVFNIKFDI